MATLSDTLQAAVQKHADRTTAINELADKVYNQTDQQQTGPQK